MTPQQARREAQNLLREAGINPDDVALDGVDKEGYDEFLCDDKGASVIVSDELATARREWPDGFPLEAFREAVWLGWQVTL